MANLRQRFVRAIYATHNESSRVQLALSKCISYLEQGDVGLNVGAGHSHMHPAILNLDIVPTESVHVVAKAEYLPFADNCFKLVVTQETLEHVSDPFQAVQEIFRVLKPGGIVYCQVPFTIGYHPGPTDFWRFSIEGIQEMIQRAGFHCDQVEIAVGPATGFYRVAVEFWAVLISMLSSRLYYPSKALAALLLFPIKWLDPILIRSFQADRIAGGYYIIAHK